MLNKINKKNFEKSLDLANFVNFADLPQGGIRGTTPTTLLANPGVILSNKVEQKISLDIEVQIFFTK